MAAVQHTYKAVTQQRGGMAKSKIISVSEIDVVSAASAWHVNKSAAASAIAAATVYDLYAVLLMPLNIFSGA